MAVSNRAGAASGASQPNLGAQQNTQQQAGAVPPNGAAYAAPGATNTVNAFWLANQFARGSVNPRTIEYLKEVDDGLKRRLTEMLGAARAEYRRIELSDPSGAQAYVVNVDGVQSASIVIFSDILPPYENHLPVSMRNVPALQSLKAEIGDVGLINTYVIRSTDLDRADRMAAVLLTDLAPAIDVNLNIPIRMMGGDGNVEFAVDTRLDSVRAMVDRMSPHALMPRMDMGFTVTMRLPRDRNMAVAGQNLAQDSVPFLVVGAYTEVLGPYPDSTGRPRFVPAIRRTAIYSSIPNLSSLLIAEVLSTEYFVRRGMWKRYYTRFAKGSPNLGQMMPDPNNPNELWFAKDMAEMETFINENFMPPMMLAEVVEGHYRIPDIALYSGRAEDYQSILTAAAAMFGVPTPTQVPPPAACVGVEYVGSFGLPGGEQRDTRSVTYLDEVAARGSVDDATRAILTNYTMLPADKATVVSGLIGTSCTFLNQSTLAATHPSFSAWLSQNVPTSVRLVDADGTYSSFTPVGNMMAGFTDYTGFGTVMHQQQRQSFGSTAYAPRRWV